MEKSQYFPKSTKHCCIASFSGSVHQQRMALHCSKDKTQLAMPNTDVPAISMETSLKPPFGFGAAPQFVNHSICIANQLSSLSWKNMDFEDCGGIRTHAVRNGNDWAHSWIALENALRKNFRQRASHIQTLKSRPIDYLQQRPVSFAQ